MNRSVHMFTIVFMIATLLTTKTSWSKFHEKKCYIQHRAYPKNRTITSLITVYTDVQNNLKRTSKMNFSVLTLKGYIGADYNHGNRPNRCKLSNYFYNPDTQTFFSLGREIPDGEFGPRIQVYSCNPKWDYNSTLFDDGEYTLIACPVVNGDLTLR